MGIDSPEVTSFGTLLGYALNLEAALADLATRAAEIAAGDSGHDALATTARKHIKRGRQLERLRRERLNEVVLQAITGIDRRAYIPVLDLPGDAAGAARTVAAAEDLAAGFYLDAAAIAKNVLTGTERTFVKLAAESRSLAAALYGDVP